MPERPNILLVHTHDTGRHLGCYGQKVATPNFDRLAGEGALFRQAFCVSPGCSPSRAGLLTGEYPHNNGMMGLCHRGFKLIEPKRHLSHLLRNAGYRTQLIGFQHEINGGDIGQLGYDHVLADRTVERDSRLRANHAVKWLEGNATQPFFLNVGFTETHREFGPLDPFEDERYTAPPAWLPDLPAMRKDTAELNSAVRRVDEGLGKILDALERLKLAGNTLVIFTTDHGIAFPRAKATLFDPGIGVALIIRGPGGFSGGQVHDALVSQLDLLPTICTLAGIETPVYAQGTPLLPLVQGKADRLHDHIVAEITHHASYDPARCVRTERHKYVRFFEDYPKMVLPNVDNGYAKYALTDAGLPQGARPREYLFDLVADPLEFENLAASPEHAQTKAALSAKLDAWMEATDDPIRHGPVPVPEGGRTTPVGAYSPNGDPRPRP